MVIAPPTPNLLLAPDLTAARRSLHPVLDLVTTIAAQTLTGAVGAGISLVEQGARISTAGTTALVGLADDQQYQLGEGPCLTAWAGSGLVRVNDLETEERWPRWRRAARELGLRSVLSTAVPGTGRDLGAIKVYGEQPRVFDRSAEQLLRRLAEQAGLLLENLQALAAAEQSSGAVRAALEARQQVARAQGVLMGRHGLGPESAFLRLTRDAARHRRSVADEASALVDDR